MFKNCWLWQMFLECVSNGIIAHDFSKRSKFEFFWEKNGLFQKRALFGFKIAHCDKFLQKVSQTVLLLKNTQNLHFLFFFLKKMGFFDKESWNVSRSLTVTNVSRMRIKRYYILWFFKTSKTWFFWGKMGFTEKRPWNVSRSLIVTSLSKNVSNGTSD